MQHALTNQSKDIAFLANQMQNQKHSSFGSRDFSRA